MADYKVSKEMTIAKIKADVKSKAVTEIIAALNKIYGEANVAFVQTGSKASNNEKRFIAVKAATAETEEGNEVDVCFGVEISTKDFVDRVTQKKTFYAFDFESAADAYSDYMAEKAIKDAKKEEAKNKKIKEDLENF